MHKIYNEKKFFFRNNMSDAERIEWKFIFV